MWEEKELGNIEFIPEPSDYRILSAADSATIGHQEGWRSEVLGWAPTPVPVAVSYTHLTLPTMIRV